MSETPGVLRRRSRRVRTARPFHVTGPAGVPPLLTQLALVTEGDILFGRGLSPEGRGDGYRKHYLDSAGQAPPGFVRQSVEVTSLDGGREVRFRVTDLEVPSS